MHILNKYLYNICINFILTDILNEHIILLRKIFLIYTSILDSISFEFLVLYYYDINIKSFCCKMLKSCVLLLIILFNARVR